MKLFSKWEISNMSLSIVLAVTGPIVVEPIFMSVLSYLSPRHKDSMRAFLESVLQITIGKNQC